MIINGNDYIVCDYDSQVPMCSVLIINDHLSPRMVYCCDTNRSAGYSLLMLASLYLFGSLILCAFFYNSKLA